MSFLFPLFLLAGLALIIPVLIHLFNLRRYKRVAFPDTRFLRNIQLSTKKQSKIRNWRLLITRLLFLAALVLAFAQPYWGGSGQRGTGKHLTVIYIDNSYSMTVAEGQMSLLQQAKMKTRQLVAASDQQSRFLLLTNDRMSAMRPLMKEEALKEIDLIQPVAKAVSLKQVLASVQAAQANEPGREWDVFFFSDLQQSSLMPAETTLRSPAHTSFYFYPLQLPDAANLYVDTAFFLSPVIDSRQSNSLLVKVRKSGKGEAPAGNVQLSVNGQVRAVSAIALRDSLWVDTLEVQMGDSGWQQLEIALVDHPLVFDDTFRLAARTVPQLSVLTVAEQGISPFLQAAFRTYEGFRSKVTPAAQIDKSEWPAYNLIVLQNIRAITPALKDAVAEALDRGQSILLFPGDISQTEPFNDALKAWGDITIERQDTSRQQVVTIQQAHPLLQDLFEKIPDNVQLPLTTRRYPISAALSASQQMLMGFRDGKPFLAQYNLGKGKLYLCAASLDDKTTNFPLSHFFVPILYKMTMQSGAGSIYALFAGDVQPIWLPAQGADRRSVWHIAATGFDAVPAQRAAGNGTEVFAGSAVFHAGFFKLYQQDVPDSIVLGINASRTESDLKLADPKLVNQALPGIHWIDERYVNERGWHGGANPFPLWKICVLVALACLAVETFFLLKKDKGLAKTDPA